MYSIIILTVELDESVGFSQWVLRHTLVRSEILRRQFPDLQDHVFVVSAVCRYCVVFFAWNRHVYFWSFFTQSRHHVNICLLETIISPFSVVQKFMDVGNASVWHSNVMSWPMYPPTSWFEMVNIGGTITRR